MAPTRTVLWLTAALALGAGAAVCAAILTGWEEDPVPLAVLGGVIGWSFIGSGLVAWSRRPDNRTGPLMIVIGFVWFLAGLQFADNSVLATTGALFETVFAVPFSYLLLAFPSGRLESRLSRAVLLAALLDVTIVQLAWMLFSDIDGPENLLQVWEHDGVALAIVDGQRIAGLVLLAITIGIIAQRWRTASGPLRRAVAPVLWSGTNEQAEVPYGRFQDVLLTKDYTPLHPEILEYKLYAKGVGPVLVLGVSGGAGWEELLSFQAGA